MFHRVTNWLAAVMFMGIILWLSTAFSYLYFNRQTIPLIVHSNSVENPVVQRGENLILTSVITRRRVCPTDITRYLLSHKDGSQAYTWETRSTIPVAPNAMPLTMQHPVKMPMEVAPDIYTLQALIINHCTDWWGTRVWSLTTPGIVIRVI